MNQYCTCLCPSCGGPATYGGAFPCSMCLSGGYYLTPQGGLSLTPGPRYTGPYYPAGDPQPGGTCPLCGGACHIAPRVDVLSPEYLGAYLRTPHFVDYATSTAKAK